MSIKTDYDVIIIGCGPAGLSAGLYASRGKLKTLILEGKKTGGQIVSTHLVANYPGSIEEATGPSLIARMVEQNKEFGSEMKMEKVKEVELQGDVKKVKTEQGNEFTSKTVIVATGAIPRDLGIESEHKYVGKGVSYCATCDADFFQDLDVYVVGGGDSALEEGLYLTKYARKVYIIHRSENFRAAQSYIDKAKESDKVEFILNSKIVEIQGDGIVEAIVLENTVTGEKTTVNADEEHGTFGIFPFIGYLPNTEIFKGKIELDERGYVIAHKDVYTNVEGVFVAGDVRQKHLRQVVTATSDGAIAAVEAEKYISHKFES